MHGVSAIFDADGRCRSFQKKQERMWGAYHEMRTSSCFTKEWEDFITHSVGVTTALPIFYQHVTDVVFHGLVKIEFPHDTAQHDSLYLLKDLV